MKNKLFSKKSLSALISLLLMVTMLSGNFVMAAEDYESDIILYTDPVPYQFPITQESPEWATFNTKQEMLDVCQVPEQKLKSMTTAALLETVMNYPLIGSYLAFNSTEVAWDVMSDDFNGFNALFSRSDVTAFLLNRYEDAKVLTKQEVLSKNVSTYKLEDVKAYFDTSIVEYLIACNEIENGSMSVSDSKRLFELLKQKNAERDAAGVYSKSSILYPLSVELWGYIWTSVPFGTIKTPRGSNVSNVYQRSPDFDTTARDNIDYWHNLDWPNANKVGNPTVKYNCHSYAWHQQSTSNPYWIDAFPSIYFTDGSYTKYYGTPYSGLIIEYINGDHSGVCLGLKTINGVQVQAVRSKWGMEGLYEHAVAYCPYYRNNTGVSTEFYR